MKIMFVCRSNTGRSQVGEVLYNKLTNSNDAISTGTIVNDGIKTVGEKPQAKNLIAVMNDRGLDISSKERIQIKESMLNDVDRVIVMAEPENIPDWLSKSEKYEYWEIDDIKNKSTEESMRIVGEIETKVKQLIGN